MWTVNSIVTDPSESSLVMTEAMACGTPVVALNRGSAPEVVRHGLAGYVVETIEEMAEAVGQVHLIRPRDCRDHVEQCFDVPRMADDYVAAYERIINRELEFDTKTPLPAVLTDTVPYMRGPIVNQTTSSLEQLGSPMITSPVNLKPPQV